MRTRSHAGRRLARGIALVAAFAAAGLAVRAAAGDPMAQLAVIAEVGNPTADAVDAMVASLALFAEALGAYLLVVAALGTVASLPGALGRLARAALGLVSTAGLRRALEATLGGVMLAHVTLAPGPRGASAAAAPAPPRPSTVVVSPEVTLSAVVAAGVLNAVSGATLGRPPTPRTARSPAVAPVDPAGEAERSADPAPTVHVVVRGDTLWDIARRHLPSRRRQPSEIARYWPTIYAANRGVIGADPDQILPGMRLSIPATPAARSRTAGGDGKTG